MKENSTVLDKITKTMKKKTQLFFLLPQILMKLQWL